MGGSSRSNYLESSGEGTGAGTRASELRGRGGENQVSLLACSGDLGRNRNSATGWGDPNLRPARVMTQENGGPIAQVWVAAGA